MGKGRIIPEASDIVVKEEAEAESANMDIKALAAWELALAKFGDGQPYNRSRIEGEVRAHFANSALNMLEAGKRLALLQAKEEHGGFLKALERIEIGQRTAYSMINAAKKFIDDKGGAKVATVANLGITKIYELATLEIEDINRLAEGGEAAGITLEEAEKLSALVLKKKLSAHRAEIKKLKERHESDTEVHNQILTEKNQKLDELDAKLRAVTDPSRWQERAEGYLQRLSRLPLSFSQATGEFAEILDSVRSMNSGDWEQSRIVLLEQAKHVYDELSTAIDALGRQLDVIAPEQNAVHHALTDLRVLPSGAGGEGTRDV